MKQQKLIVEAFGSKIAELQALDTKILDGASLTEQETDALTEMINAAISENQATRDQLLTMQEESHVSNFPPR